MQKQNMLILVLLFISIIVYIVYTKASASNISEEYAIKIGEEKYLKFLWIVDGAFNEERMGGEYSVNGKKLDKSDKSFSWKKKKKNKDTCVNKNFYEEFRKLFTNNIRYDYVYGDGMTYSWIKYENDKYYFTNPNNCSTNRMGLEHKLTIREIHDDKIVYNVTYDSHHNHPYSNEFVLINDKDEWKISEATYYDLCEMEYHIE